VQIFNAFLSEQEQIDICDESTYTYETELYLDLPCNHRANDLIGNRAKDITSNNRNATLGDGLTASTMPTKLLEKNGYYFNGTTHYLSGLTAPTGDYTVVICKRVNGFNNLISVTFEEDLTTFNKLITNGLFIGYLLSIRIFNIHLTDTQKCHEEILLLNRVDEYSLGKSCISNLIAEGSCVLFHDYRRGSFKDLSVERNYGVPSSTVVWDEDSLDFSDANACVVVPSAVSLNITQGTIIILSDFNPIFETEYLISKRDSGGTSFELYLDTNGTIFKLFDGTNTREITYATYDSECLAVNFIDGARGELYSNGAFVSFFDSWSEIGVNDAPITIGCQYDFAHPSSSKIKAVIVCNRKLSAEEHNRVYEELKNNTSITEVYAHKTLEARETVYVRDNGLMAAYDGAVMELNVLKNLKQDLYNMTLDGQSLKNKYFNSLYNRLPGNSISTGITSAILDPAGVSHTLSALVKVNAWQTLSTRIIALFGKGVSQYVYAYSYPRYGGVFIDTEALDRKIGFSYHDADLNIYKTILTSYPAQLNTWYHIVYSIDHINKIASFFINGVLIGTTTVGAMNNNSNVKVDSFRFFGINGTDYAVVDAPDTEMNYMQVYKGTKDLTWVVNQFETIKKTYTYTSFGVQESIIAEPTLTNTDFQNANYVMVVDDIVENQHCKVIEGSISSAINIKVKFLE
jgi:hypothetical protein